MNSRKASPPSRVAIRFFVAPSSISEKRSATSAITLTASRKFPLESTIFTFNASKALAASVLPRRASAIRSLKSMTTSPVRSNSIPIFWPANCKTDISLAVTPAICASFSVSMTARALSLAIVISPKAAAVAEAAIAVPIIAALDLILSK